MSEALVNHAAFMIADPRQFYALLQEVALPFNIFACNSKSLPVIWSTPLHKGLRTAAELKIASMTPVCSRPFEQSGSCRFDQDRVRDGSSHIDSIACNDVA